MTVNYTTNLALGLPVTGTESGTWGDDVNNAITAYLDISIAGGLAVTVTTADVTLANTQGTSAGTGITTLTAQYAILNVSGAMTAARNLIVPSSSKWYIVNNNTTGGFLLTVKGSATSGVTLVNGESAHIYWNGSDYAKLSNAQGGAGSFTNLAYTGTLTGSTGVIAIGTNQIYKDASGNVGIGTSSPANKLDVRTAGGTSAVMSLVSGSNATQTKFNIGQTGSVDWDVGISVTAGNFYIGGLGGTMAEAYRITRTGAAIDFQTWNTGGSERMRIDSSGNLLVGGTTVRDSAEITCETSSNGLSVYVVPNTSAVDFAIFRANAGTLCGAISRVGTTAAVVYTATSDYRLKENVAPMTGALAKIAALKPVTFTWKDGGSVADGFIAHEFAEVCPNGVTGEKDGVDVDGNPKYQAMDSSAAISILVAAIQEQQALITSLTARIEALEST